MADCLFELTSSGLAIITLNVPERRNAISMDMADLLEGYLARCERDADVRCVLLTGAGKAFCAGGDVQGMKDRSERGKEPERSQLGMLDERVRALRERQEGSVLKLYTMAKPTVAVINGAAVGAGLSHALACDLRIMSDEAKLMAGFAKMALSGDMGGTYFLSQLVNTSIARELCFTGDPVDASRALSLGLVNRVFPHATLMEQAIAFCETLAAGPTATFGRIKSNLIFAANATVRSALDFEATNMVFGSLGRDHQEAIRGFMEKRASIFTGS